MQLELDYLHFLVLGALYAGSAACAIHAVMDTRTAQGAVAWAIGLISFPFLFLPLYLVFGRRKFVGYVQHRREAVARLHRMEALGDLKRPDAAGLPDWEVGTMRTLESLSAMPFTTGNEARLLIDGEATFAAIFQAIAEARLYVLVQFYIVRDDGLGERLKSALVEAAARGVKAHLLYDEIGSNKTARRYFEDLRQAGVAVSSFNSTARRWNRWQVNFRNHRKIVVADGHRAFIGGHNVGDEYLGLDPTFGHWRDTHVALQGPVVLACQMSFYEDWFWATGQRLSLSWSVDRVEQGLTALVLPSGPADEVETCQLLFTQLINAANRRIWLVSPYYVPDQAIVTALQLAVMRGVEVRILVPEKPDHLVIWLAAFPYLHEAVRSGIQVYRYTGGFLHQKVVLVDDQIAAVGTANLDNRSLRLNFEITLLAAGRDFAEKVETMLRADFARSRRFGEQELPERGWLFRFAARTARLAAPVL